MAGIAEAQSERFGEQFEATASGAEGPRGELPQKVVHLLGRVSEEVDVVPDDRHLTGRPWDRIAMSAKLDGGKPSIPIMVDEVTDDVDVDAAIVGEERPVRPTGPCRANVGQRCDQP